MHQGPSAGPNGPPMPLNLKRNVMQHASASSSLLLPPGTKANEAKALVAEIHPAHGSRGLPGDDARSAAPPPSRLQLLRRGSPSVKSYYQSPLQDCLEHCFHLLPQGHPPYRAFRSSGLFVPNVGLPWSLPSKSSSSESAPM
eukprot:Skav212171  [mRNA]  locus=scaffold754:313873:314318:- [translate_table: standard]